MSLGLVAASRSILFRASAVVALFATPAIAGDVHDLETLLDDPVLDGAVVGIAVLDLDADTVVFDHNGNTRLVPASNLKLLTSAAALELLGPDYRFVTSFYIKGAIDSAGFLEGDLLIKGGGDPLISGRFRKSVTEVLERWVDSLGSRNIRRINGNLAVDNTFFSGDPLGPGWSQDDLSYWYACQISALSFNDNCVDLRVLPGERAGEPCRIALDPPTDYIDTLNNTMTLAPGEERTFDFRRYSGTNFVEFFGGLAADDSDGIIDYVSVDDPYIYCAHAFREVLTRRGIAVDGVIFSVDEAPPSFSQDEFAKLFEWRSDSLGVILSVINKNSQNFFAEQTLRTIAAELRGEGSTKQGVAAVADWLESIGIGKEDVHYCDGSGLSFENLATPGAIARVLDYMSRSQNFGVYFESLGIPTVDRSVKDRMGVQRLARLMRAKTGSIVNSRAFSGYLLTETGRLMAFSIMVNNFSAESSQIVDWLDKVCECLIDNF